jgi:hypothetical protein
LFDSVPVLQRLRLSPAQITRRRLRERNAAEDAHAGGLRATPFNNSVCSSGLVHCKRRHSTQQYGYEKG